MVALVWLATITVVGTMSRTDPRATGGGDAASPGVRSSDTRSTGRFVDGTVSSAAGVRRWRLWVPAGYDASRRFPLVVMLHGCTQDPNDFARGTRVTDHADQQGVLVLLPEQPDSANPKKCWNWYDPAHQRRDAGEPSLIAGATRQVAAAWSVDTRRTYVAGISAGAAMASLVAVAYPELYAAVGMHSGIPYRAASTVVEGVGVMANGAGDTRRLAQLAWEDMGSRARRIPAIIVQGADDPVVRLVNATHTRDVWLGMNSLVGGGEASAQAAARRTDGNVGGLAVTRECFGERDGSRGCEVELLMIAGLGHAWSGGSTVGTFTDERGPDATAEMLRFLLAHAMPPTATPNAAKP